MGRYKGSRNFKWDKVELQRLYWEKGLSTREIGKLLKVTPQAVKQAMNRRGVARRNHSEAISGERHYRFKGKYKDTLGYIVVWAPDHPYAYNKHVKEHRLIVERKLGRYLLPTEIVHHLNGIYDDNRLENLVVFSRKTHANLIPALQKRIRQLERNRQQALM